MKVTAPIDIEILLHYYYSPGQHKQAENEKMDNHFQFFVDQGLLTRNDITGHYTAVREALDCYVNKLMEVELPEHIWV